jgi:hypothetical protein
MVLPVKPPYLPMEAALAAERPSGERWHYEPMGCFRCLAVVEVQYRFRHGSKFLRWRPDRSPKAGSMAQVKRRERAVAPKI